MSTASKRYPIGPGTLLLLALVFCLAGRVFAGPKQATILVVRHAEKPDQGTGLTPAGEARANAYVGYFSDLKAGSESLKPDEIFAAADSKNSQRPRLTMEPLAHALSLTINTAYKDKDFSSLVNALQTGHDGKKILVCWHHGAMADLLKALGAEPTTLLPGSQWPSNQYDWLIELRYDADGKLQEAHRVVEGF